MPGNSPRQTRYDQQQDSNPNRYSKRGDVAGTTLQEWVKRYEIDAGVRDGMTTAERERIKALEREVKELRQANEILRLASAFFAQAELDRLKKK